MLAMLILSQKLFLFTFQIKQKLNYSALDNSKVFLYFITKNSQTNFGDYMKSQKLSFFSLFIFMVLANKVIYTYYFIPKLINLYGNIAYLFPLLMIIVGVIAVLLLPKKFFMINYLSLIKKSRFLKYIYASINYITAILFLLVSSHVLSNVFFEKYDYMLFLGSLFVVGIYIGLNENKLIVNSSTLLILVGLLSYIVPSFFNGAIKDYTLLKPMDTFNGDFYFLTLSYLLLDIISISMIAEKSLNNAKKWNLLIPIIFIFAFYSFDMFNLILTTGISYLKDIEYLGFFILYVEDTVNYIGNFGLFYVYTIPLISLFRIGLSLSLVRNVLNIESSFKFSIILILPILFIVYFIEKFLPVNSCTEIIVYLLLILLSIVYLFIIMNRSEKYEVKF